MKFNQNIIIDSHYDIINQIIKEVKTEIKKKGQNIQKHRLEIVNVLKFKASINQCYFQFVCVEDV